MAAISMDTKSQALRAAQEQGSQKVSSLVLMSRHVSSETNIAKQVQTARIRVGALKNSGSVIAKK
jgi:hypothetical protein